MGKLTATRGTSDLIWWRQSGTRCPLLTGGRFIYVLNRGSNSEGNSACTAIDPCPNANITQFAIGGNGVLTAQETFYTQGINPFLLHDLGHVGKLPLRS